MHTLFKYTAQFLALAVLTARSVFGQTPSFNNRVQNNCPVPDLVWQGLGTDENQSMPFGNGDITVNAWTEQTGDIILLLGKSDSWAEDGSLLKIGRIRLHITPSPFTDSAGVTQTLAFSNGMVEIKKGNNIVRLWADANQPVVHVRSDLAVQAKLSAVMDPWRKMQRAASVNLIADPEVMQGEKAARLHPDLWFTSGKKGVAWCHYNADSYYPYALRQQHLGSLIGKYPDPLLHRCFGALMTGKDMVVRDSLSIETARAAKDAGLDIIVYTDKESSSPQHWLKEIQDQASRLAGMDPLHLLKAHNDWWAGFWNRSYIKLSGTEEARKVNEGYAIQRYMMGSSSRGELPVKFNGGAFTVGHNMAEGARQTKEDHDPDYRAWGECYWNQNNRLLYWPLIATGDTDLIRPWLNMYTNRLAFEEDRNKLYYDHAGASYPETMYFWGLPRMGDFGKNNPTNIIQSHWQRYHIQGTLEIISQMLDLYDYYGNGDYLKRKGIPFADAIVTYYDLHWKRGQDGKLNIAPAQSLETYQLDAVNPTPDIAGLKSILPRLLALPRSLVTVQQRKRWEKLLGDLPDLPTGRTTKGKIPLPAVAPSDPDGERVLLPAEKYGKRGNSENPELYTVFPYRLYGVGKPDLELARRTYYARRAPQNTCWGQDGTQSSLLGLTGEAKKAAIAEFTNYGDQRFKWFWKSAHDYIADMDNGGDGMITLQNMLMQCDGRQIRLMAAWPKDWTADFKLHAPGNTTVEGHVEAGKLSRLKVTPAARASDVIMGGRKAKK